MVIKYVVNTTKINQEGQQLDRCFMFRNSMDKCWYLIIYFCYGISKGPSLVYSFNPIHMLCTSLSLQILGLIRAIINCQNMKKHCQYMLQSVRMMN